MVVEYSCAYKHSLHVVFKNLAVIRPPLLSESFPLRTVITGLAIKPQKIHHRTLRHISRCVCSFQVLNYIILPPTDGGRFKKKKKCGRAWRQSVWFVCQRMSDAVFPLNPAQLTNELMGLPCKAEPRHPLYNFFLLRKVQKNCLSLNEISTILTRCRFSFTESCVRHYLKAKMPSRVD